MVVVVESRYASPVLRSEVVGYDSGSLAIKEKSLQCDRSVGWVGDDWFWAAGGRLEKRRSSIHEQANNRDEALRTMKW